MKKINKKKNKGFTLIELLAVLVILGIIMTIALPNITSSVERSKNKQNEQQIKLIESAAELYFDDHKNDNLSCVSVSTLINEKYLSEKEAKDSKGNSFDGSVSSTGTYFTNQNCTG